MKKMKLVFLFMMVMFVCTGCENNSEVTRDLRHSGFNMDREPFNCDALIPKSDKEFEMIKYLGSNYAITTNGVIYDIFTDENDDKFIRTYVINNSAKLGDKIFASEEDKLSLVKTIVDSAEYLSERKIGALICIERIDSLDSLINKAIYIKGKVSMELLTSLFYTGSATHDGAVIIRKNNILVYRYDGS